MVMHYAGHHHYRNSVDLLKYLSGYSYDGAWFTWNDCWLLLGYNGQLANLFWRKSTLSKKARCPAVATDVVPKLIGNVFLLARPYKNATCQIPHVKL